MPKSGRMPQKTKVAVRPVSSDWDDLDEIKIVECEKDPVPWKNKKRPFAPFFAAKVEGAAPAMPKSDRMPQKTKLAVRPALRERDDLNKIKIVECDEGPVLWK